MAKNETDLFDRLRKVGVRRQVAKTLSDIGDGASKKAVKAAQGAAAELRSLADEIERRLPHSSTAKASSASSRRAAAPAPRTRSAAPAPKRTAARRTAATRSAAASSNGARAPRGQNKAKILASLKTGPKTASEIAKETGIGTGTVGSTLSKMATAGEVRKAERGYGLPS